MLSARRLPWFAALLCLAPGCTRVQAPTQVLDESLFLRNVRSVEARVARVLASNHKSFDTPAGRIEGFGAGAIYPQIWLRDSAWMVDAAATLYPKETLVSWLDLHLANAERSGRLRDWVAKGSIANFREWAPRVQEKSGIAFDTNSNESDQEPSAALAWCRAARLLGPDAADATARDRRAIALGAALDALIRDRTDAKTGLIWSGLTADWGDVSPMHPDQNAIYLDSKTPRTLPLYANVMTWAALDCLAALEGPKERQRALAARADKLKARVQSNFWMESRGYFRIRRNLDPVPAAFGDPEDERFALGGNALAVLFGLADDAQAASIFAAAERLRAKNGFSTISTTLIPPYPAGVFQHPSMREPFQYQNGGQWDWYGAALVEAEFARGHSEQARVHLEQILTRAIKAGPGLHEWYGQDGSPQGSGSYGASAAALHNAIVQGLLGITPSGSGAYRVALRAGEALLPFEVKNRPAGTSFTVSQVVDASGIEVRIEGTARIREVCTLVPVGRAPAAAEGVVRTGKDASMCLDVSSRALPIHARFALRAQP
jgi:glycogen debranching enzyme